MYNLKIFHASDLHFNKSYFEYILSSQNKFDIFCFSGDLLDGFNPLTHQKEQTIAWLKSFKKPVFVCSGNHDMPAKWLNDTSGIYADGSIKTINGLKFGCAPYMCDDLLEFSDCEILLTHVPPANTKTSIDKNGKDYGDNTLYWIIKNNLLKPKIVLCGHIHDPKAHIDILNGVKIYNSASNDTKGLFFEMIEI